MLFVSDSPENQTKCAVQPSYSQAYKLRGAADLNAVSSV